MHNESLTTDRMSHFVGFGLLLAFILPHTSTALLLVNPLLCIFYQLFRQNRVFYKNNLIVLIPIMITFCINLPQSISTKSLLITATILLYFMCFPIVGKVKVPNAYFHIILFVIFFSQIVYILKIPFLVNTINTLYPITGNDVHGVEYMQNSISLQNMLNYRMGGLYRNPNQCSRSLTLLLSCFLLLNKGEAPSKWLPFAVVSFVAVLLTGSRTGFVVASVVLLLFFYWDRSISKGWKWALLFALIIGLAFLLILGSSSSSFRGVNVSQGLNSPDAKFHAFQDYLKQENSIFRLLFGYLDPQRFEASSIDILTKFDADFGYVIFQYGFIGFIAFVLYFFTLFRRIDKWGRMFFVLLLWMLTSAIITSYRAVFIFTIMLSLIYNHFPQNGFVGNNIRI